MVCLAAVALSQCWAAVARAESEPLVLSKLSLPAEIGNVTQVLEAPANPSGKTLLIIQDAHMNYEAQQNLAKILDRLATERGLRLILVEGSSGDIGLAAFRNWVSRDAARATAEVFLKDGEFTGEEYLDVVSDHPLILWGIEDDALYEANYLAFRDVQEIRPELEKDFEAFGAVIDSLKGVVFSEALAACQRNLESYAAGTMPLGDYMDYLVSAGESAGLDLGAYPHVQRFAQVRKLEAQNDLAQVTAQQAQSVQALRSKISETDLQKLSDLGRQAKEGVGGASALFYRELERLLAAYAVPVDTFPQLANYFAYLKAREGLDAKQLWHELEPAGKALRSRVVHSPEESQLLEIIDTLALLRGLVRLKWTPRDYQDFQQAGDRMLVAQWLPRLKELAQEKSVAVAWQGDAGELDETLGDALRFYEAAHARNQAIAAHVLAKMDETSQNLAVLILGGFHTDKITEMLTAQGVQLAVITPRVGDVTDEARYAQVVTERMERILRRRYSQPQAAAKESSQEQ